MAYRIKAYYRTGDSFGSQDEETVLEMEWSTQEAAKAALDRIEEHWRWYENEYKDRWSQKKNKVKRPKWSEGLYEGVVKVTLDNGEEVQFCAPWCGYFERLYGAQIVNDLPSFGEIPDRFDN